MATVEDWEKWIERVREEFSDAFQHDFEHGVKWLNEQAVIEFETKYPAISKAIGYILNGLDYDKTE
jgi:hypothetical protein